MFVSYKLQYRKNTVFTTKILAEKKTFVTSLKISLKCSSQVGAKDLCSYASFTCFTPGTDVYSMSVKSKSFVCFNNFHKDDENLKIGNYL